MLRKYDIKHGPVGESERKLGRDDEQNIITGDDLVVDIWEEHLKNAGYSDKDLNRKTSTNLHWNPPHDGGIDPVHFSVKNYVHNPENAGLVRDLKWYTEFYADDGSPQIKNKHSYTRVLKHAAEKYGLKPKERMFSNIMSAIAADKDLQPTEEVRS